MRLTRRWLGKGFRRLRLKISDSMKLATLAKQPLCWTFFHSCPTAITTTYITWISQALINWWWHTRLLDWFWIDSEGLRLLLFHIWYTNRLISIVVADIRSFCLILGKRMVIPTSSFSVFHPTISTDPLGSLQITVVMTTLSWVRDWFIHRYRGKVHIVENLIMLCFHRA